MGQYDDNDGVGDDGNGEGCVQMLDGIAGARCHLDGGQMASAALDPKSKLKSCCYALCTRQYTEHCTL